LVCLYYKLLNKDKHFIR